MNQINEEPKDIYKAAMANIGYRVAMQSIRKVMRDSGTNDVAKLNSIMCIIHSFEKDLKED